ncbi:MAG: SOS response-associated peptidase [Candidatus Nanopelagicales bacterium]
MCGRFVAKNELETIKEVFHIKESTNFQLPENYNVSPTQKTYAIQANDSNKPMLSVFNWGFTAAWDEKRKLANARSESILEKKSFRDSFLHRRCLVPMNGYYEWFRIEEKPKQAYFIYSKKMQLLPVAGIFLNDEMTILTRAANSKLEKIHDRMPVLVPPANWNYWLDRSLTDPEQIMDLTPIAPDDLLNAYPVADQVNNSRSQGRELTNPTGEEF